MDQPSFVVTGGARGVGRSIAHRLAQDGHVVVLDVIGALDWDDPSIQLVSGDARTRWLPEKPHNAARSAARSRDG